MRVQRHAPAALYPGKEPVLILQETGWAPGSVWTGAENLVPTGIRSPDRPARSQSLYQLSYPGHILPFCILINCYLLLHDKSTIYRCSVIGCYLTPLHLSGQGQVSRYSDSLRAGRSDGSNSGDGKILRTHPDWLWDPPSLLCSAYRVSFQGLKRPGRALDHSPTI